MKRKYKDILACSLFIFVYLLIYFIFTRNGHIFGSEVDFTTQHYLIPDYFRQLFYKTHDLLPDFAFNLAGGQNIFNFSYYGLFNPTIMISYLFKSVSMLDYLTVSVSLVIVLSAILFYFFLRKHNCGFVISFVVSMLFLLAGPIIFHVHRHVMFINYFLFLIMGLFGVDSYLKNKNILLLVTSIFLMILTSYYYSVGGLVVLFIYYLYCIVKKNDLKFKNIFFFGLTMLLGVMMGCIIILPTLYALLNGRGDSTSSISLISLIKPDLSFDYFLYRSYSIGLTGFSLISIIYLIFKGNKEDKFLSIILLLFSIFPIFNFILNGTLYIDSKTLIPFILLVLIEVSVFLKLLFKNMVNYNILFLIMFILLFIVSNVTFKIELVLLFMFYMIYKFNKNKNIFVLFVILYGFGSCLAINSSEKFEKKSHIIDDSYVISSIASSDDDFYRINNMAIKAFGLNSVTNLNEYKTSSYSSVTDPNYKKLYFDVFNNPIVHRNRAMMAYSNNVLFQMFMSEKYVVTDKKVDFNYSVFHEDSNYVVYKNENVLPIGYARSDLISIDDFNNMSYPNNVINMLNNIVVNEEKSNSNLIELAKTNVDYDIVDYKNLEYNVVDGHYVINSSKNGTMNINLNNTNDKVLFIRFKNNKISSCSDGDIGITINGVKNKLTCKEWKYYNDNVLFDYVFYNTTNLIINFSKGNYDLSDFEFYLLDYDYISDINKNTDEFKIDKTNTKGDNIVGSISVSNDDSYFTISIPYDKGFSIKVDGIETKYEKVNVDFIGFKIDKGEHSIVISYEAPYKKIGIIICLIGALITLIVTIVRGVRGWKK